MLLLSWTSDDMPRSDSRTIVDDQFRSASPDR